MKGTTCLLLALLLGAAVVQARPPRNRRLLGDVIDIDGNGDSDPSQWGPTEDPDAGPIVVDPSSGGGKHHQPSGGDPGSSGTIVVEGSAPQEVQSGVEAPTFSLSDAETSPQSAGLSGEQALESSYSGDVYAVSYTLNPPMRPNLWCPWGFHPVSSQAEKNAIKQLLDNAFFTQVQPHMSWYSWQTEQRYCENGVQTLHHGKVQGCISDSVQVRAGGLVRRARHARACAADLTKTPCLTAHLFPPSPFCLQGGRRDAVAQATMKYSCFSSWQGEMAIGEYTRGHVYGL